jgi:diguanylate cyclase (GGDEF)-like protein
LPVQIQDFGRLSVAVMLLVIWSVRRVERANLQWAMAYALLTVSQLLAEQASASSALHFTILACNLAACLLLWVGAELFRHQRPARAGFVIAALSAVLLSLIQRLLHLSWLPDLVACAVAAATCYAAYHVYHYARAFRATGIFTFVAAVLLLLHDLFWPGRVDLRAAQALAYVVLALSIAHVTFKQFQTRLLSVINTDALTGLSNRVAFVEGMQALLHATVRDPIHVAVLCIDIENFRSVNEAIGHRAGNRVLCELAARLKHAAQRVYMVARDEGDRFLLLMSATSDVTAMRNAEELALQVLNAVTAPFRVGDTDLPLRIRIGADIAWGPDADIEALIQHSTVASGRQRNLHQTGLQFYNAHMNQVALRKLDLERGLREALHSNELSLAFQAIVDVDSHAVTMAEALLRWTSPSLGEVAPSEMIPVAEESRLIIDIGEWVVGEAARHIAMWQQGGFGVPVSVNVSVYQLRRPEFAKRVLEQLAEHGVPAAMFELELTESVFLGEDVTVMSNVNALDQAGVKLSLDDFGTGFSSLSYLTRLPLSTIKIDKTFVHQLQADERSRRLTETICAIGHQLDLQLTAEGVESEQQCSALRSFGVQRMQGFYFARPVSGAEFTAVLEQHARRAKPSA